MDMPAVTAAMLLRRLMYTGNARYLEERRLLVHRG